MNFRSTFLKSVACLSIVFTSTIETFAQWATSGPYGGSVSASLTFNNKVFIGTRNGVFVSSDNGLTWNQCNKGMEKITTNSLEAMGNILVAGTAGNGIYFSFDNGANWSQRSNGLSSLSIFSLQASGTDLLAGTSDGVFLSVDTGRHWSFANNGIPATYTIYDFTETGSTILAATYGNGLYATQNHGASWTKS